jgi:hypothetical protein
VRSLNQSWGCSLDWRSTDLSIRRINPHGEIRRVANACPAGEHRCRQCSFFLVPHLPLADPPCMKVCSTFLCRVGFFTHFLSSFQVSLNQTYLQSSVTVIKWNNRLCLIRCRRAPPQEEYSFGLGFNLPRILQNLNLDRASNETGRDRKGHHRWPRCHGRTVSNHADEAINRVDACA